MLYKPKEFDIERLDLIHEIIDHYNFATLVSVRNQAPIISHLPFIFEPIEGKKGILRAHMARANAQWRSFKSDEEVTVIFQGPHAYISPRWYEFSADNVPTWNYAMVHVSGIPKIIAGEREAYAIIQNLVDRHDHDWPLELSENNRREFLRQIVVFEIEIAQIDAKFKLSQNRSAVDQQNVIQHLARSSFDMEKQTADLMLRLNPG